jgi:hypothetical protein
MFLSGGRVAGEFEEDLFEIGEHCPEVRDFDPVLRQAVNYVSHEIVPGTTNREGEILARDRLKSRDRSKMFLGGSVVGRKSPRFAPGSAVGPAPPCADVDDAHPITQICNANDQGPRGNPALRRSR